MDKKNVLIVEDHALTSFALKTSLSCVDFIDEVIDVNNANDAFVALDENEIDLILLDLGLPEIDGVEALKIIREKDKDIKIVILTSHCDKDEVLKCLEHGINAYCTKEIKPDKLCDVIKDVLDGSMYFDSKVSSYVMEQTSKNNEEKVLGELSVKDCYNLKFQSIQLKFMFVRFCKKWELKIEPKQPSRRLERI